jgi:L-alanine-DL-glutamate epimerase-like enolase superfamily enzyme
MFKDFISKQTDFNKSVEKKLGKIDVLASKVDSLSLDVELLKLKVLPHDVKESRTLNALQVRIDDNVRMLAELHARWEREVEIARIMNICTITTTSDVVSNAS